MVLQQHDLQQQVKTESTSEVDGSLETLLDIVDDFFGSIFEGAFEILKDLDKKERGIIQN